MIELEQIQWRLALMSNQSEKDDEIPAIQKLFDRPFLWLVLGFLVMAVFYTLWGIFEIITLPVAPLP
jgi:hypothetical protein